MSDIPATRGGGGPGVGWGGALSWDEVEAPPTGNGVLTAASTPESWAIEGAVSQRAPIEGVRGVASSALGWMKLMKSERLSKEAVTLERPSWLARENTAVSEVSDMRSLMRESVGGVTSTGVLGGTGGMVGVAGSVLGGWVGVVSNMLEGTA